MVKLLGELELEVKVWVVMPEPALDAIAALGSAMTATVPTAAAPPAFRKAWRLPSPASRPNAPAAGPSSE